MENSNSIDAGRIANNQNLSAYDKRLMEKIEQVKKENEILAQENKRLRAVSKSL